MVSYIAIVIHRFCRKISEMEKISREFLRNFLEFLRNFLRKLWKFLGFFCRKENFGEYFRLYSQFRNYPRHCLAIWTKYNWSTFRTICLKYCPLRKVRDYWYTIWNWNQEMFFALLLHIHINVTEKFLIWSLKIFLFIYVHISSALLSITRNIQWSCINQYYITPC